MTQAEIGKRIAEERKAQGLSIRQLAKMCEISTTTLQGVEKGWFDGKISTYLKIAETLGLEMAIFEITIP
jgi:transcriptional regulator with XRE-family HTH domain